VKKAYLDANILIAYAVGPEKDNQYYKSKEIFDKIRQNTFVGVISTLTLAEILGVLRVIKASEDLEYLNKLRSQEQLDYVLNESKILFDTMVGELLQMPNVMFERGKNTNFQSMLDDVLSVLNNIKGVVKIYNNCKKCGSNLPVSTHKGVATVDLLHALMAKDIGCDSLITFDKGFNELKSESKFDSIEIDVR